MCSFSMTESRQRRANATSDEVKTYKYGWCMLWRYTPSYMFQGEFFFLLFAAVYLLILLNNARRKWWKNNNNKKQFHICDFIVSQSFYGILLLTLVLNSNIIFPLSSSFAITLCLERIPFIRSNSYVYRHRFESFISCPPANIRMQWKETEQTQKSTAKNSQREKKEINAEERTLQVIMALH